MHYANTVGKFFYSVTRFWQNMRFSCDMLWPEGGMKMIEVIYEKEHPKKSKNEILFSIPRNIRQIGFGGDVYRIYIEDYVYTFLCRLSEMEKEEKEAKRAKGALAVLTGEVKTAEDITYVFIKGAIVAEGAEATSEHIGFSEEIWKNIQDDEEKYFPFQQIVGWFFAEAQLPIEMTEVLSRVHLQYFGGSERVLMLMDPLEKEDGFFCYENGYFLRRSGYYIYYEKNEPMQTYMLEKNQWMTYEASEGIPDEAVKTFRNILRKKKKGELAETEGETSVFSYAVTACLVLMIVVTGVNFYKNQGEMRNLQKETAAIHLADGTENSSGPSEENSVRNPEEEINAVEAEYSDETQNSEIQISDPDVEDIAAESEIVMTPVPETTVTAAPDAISLEEDVDSAREEPDPEEGKRYEIPEDSASASAGMTTYVIRPGDTLFEISMMNYGNTEAIAEICRINHLAVEEIIYPGQIIVLP